MAGPKDSMIATLRFEPLVGVFSCGVRDSDRLSAPRVAAQPGGPAECHSARRLCMLSCVALGDSAG